MTSGGGDCAWSEDRRARRGAADTQRRDGLRAGLGVRGAERSRERVTPGRSPRMLAGPRMAARGGGARTAKAGRDGACALPRVGGRARAQGARRKRVPLPSASERGSGMHSGESDCGSRLGQAI